MGIDPFNLEQTIADALLKDVPIPIHHDIYGVDLVPSNILLSAAEVQLHSAIAREWRLKQALSCSTFNLQVLHFLYFSLFVSTES